MLIMRFRNMARRRRGGFAASIDSIASRSLATGCVVTAGSSRAVVVAGSVLMASALLWSLTNGTVLCLGDQMSMKELVKAMGEMIKAPRAKLKSQNRAAPGLSVRTINFEGQFGDVTETHVVEIMFKPKDCNPLLLAKQWLAAFGDPEDAVQQHLESIRAFYKDPSAATLPLVSKDKTTSITFAKSSAPDGVKVSVALFKDGGYSRAHMDKIIAGYSDGFGGAPPPTGKSFVEFNYSPAVLKDDGGLLKEFIRGRSDGQQDLTMGGDTPAPPSADPLEDLKAMGVEVFDKSNNADMTWDQLAGYAQVKEKIQETVVLALQYPEIYDQVAQHTRAHFESNRPKAVLLEGPPGTGKTLTARILASQCDTPLVVLNLESIVSKWYGDSEKKLSKILDACDRINGGAILFVDEIDALATSRDSETGMHEVTRRVLSVLLTRLEGFKGKSKSIMICTTNRKRDLDPALLSRFDLNITYALPDASTREEIFKRYAKQFVGAGQREGSPYRALAESSEGLSCRDIKEACQQAERMCASRYIQQEVLKKSSQSGGAVGLFGFVASDAKRKEAARLSPDLDDYLKSLKQRQTQQRAVGMLGEGRGGVSV